MDQEDKENSPWGVPTAGTSPGLSSTKPDRLRGEMPPIKAPVFGRAKSGEVGVSEEVGVARLFGEGSGL